MRASRTVLAAVTAASLAVGIFAAVEMGSRHPASEAGPAVQESAEQESAIRGDVYPDSSRAAGDLASALARAAREKKRVIVDFGGNWCPDCRVLDIYLHNRTNLPLLNRSYILVDVNIGRYDQNQDLAAKYSIPLDKGVPALAVLDSDGQILYSQRNGEFEAMRGMDPASVTGFLEKWKP